ncbi:MAG: DUF1846 family protein [Patescibacteria group bacterium]|nr:DUF1846 family protein [Patescibacteria group bacterium]
MIPLYRKKGFDTAQYLAVQTQAIEERVKKFAGKLYLEFGGKLCYDYHAARVLPGYEPTAKVQLLRKLKDIEIIYCVGAKDIQKGRVRRDFGLTYDNQTLKDIADLAAFGLKVRAVVITRFAGESLAKRLQQKLEIHGITTYLHAELDGYPDAIDRVVSRDGYGRQPYVKTEMPIVIVTGAGGGSGKMSFCLSQMYHDKQHGVTSGFAKFETFPIWNLPLNHPVNTAYEAATADLRDCNIVDPFHQKAYGVTAINYNRDIENFSIMKKMIAKILGTTGYAAQYQSPTDMGVNMAKAGIIDDAIIQAAAKQEIIRRYFRYHRERMEGIESQATVDWVAELLKKAGVKITDRAVVAAARAAVEEAKTTRQDTEGIFCGAAYELSNGKIVTGKNSALLHAESAATLNAIKVLAKIPDEIDLLSSGVIQKIIDFKKEYLGSHSGALDLEETLIALTISAATNPMAEKALKMLARLENCEMHITHLPNHGNEQALMKLRINYTTDAELALQAVFS